ncbi:MAG: DUF1998 domain-containing protein [Pseudomonadota bacterium]|nr:DUF1998 domain-containing protein [Pseudomonadota bacterium]
MQTINETIKQLHDALSEYIEATYHIAAPTLIAQRQELLAKPGVIHQVPYLESTPRYEAGKKFADIEGLPAAALEVFSALAKKDGGLSKLLYDPPYRHQSEALENSLVRRKNLVIMTGTGSGKTESFLLPILGKLALEAQAKPKVFVDQPAMRALILYPMNALVNDQLGRLRSLFADARLVALFKKWSGRPPRFARYTSRTPYAGIRTSDKDSQKLTGFENFYVSLQRKAETGEGEEREEAARLLRDLQSRGKWPAKADLAAWFGQKGTRWQDKNGEFKRAITLPDDSELLTRHEVQEAPPDLLVTNYSMLEYMLMRPIERSIFDATKEWLAKNPTETFLVVLDEAHLYRGAAGAEVGLLLRRLRDRIGIPAERFQVICATASFKDQKYAPEFGAQISGADASTFVAITGRLDLRQHAATGSNRDAEVLASINLEEFYREETDAERIKAVRALLDYRGVKLEGSTELALYEALSGFAPMGHLINTTMKQARPVATLGAEIFPTSKSEIADPAVTVLMALGSLARPDEKAPGLLPCRVHNFFRGLPGLWVCMDPNCKELGEDQRDGICGKMYSQPRDFCACNARVLEFYTCRNCGSGYARAYTDDLDTPRTLWSKPGRRMRLTDHDASPLLPIDILLEKPTNDLVAEIADFDLETASVNPEKTGERMRSVYLRSNRAVATQKDDGENEQEDAIPDDGRGQFIPCGVCGKTASYGRSYIQDHQTKGDEPFQALVTRQIQIQPPGPIAASQFAPLQGRKVLTFSDSRQVAARLAPNLQNYSVRDSLRPLIVYGFRCLQSHAVLRTNLSLEDLYLAVLLASQELRVRLRPELKLGESSAAEQTVVSAIQDGSAATDVGLQNLCIELRTEKPPEALLENLIKTLGDRFLGLEALALASIVERAKHTPALEKLPSIPGYAETPEARVALGRSWLRCWQSNGFWLNSMPLVWANRPRSEGTSVKARKGKIKAMEKILLDKASRKIFDMEWTPQLLKLFTQDVESGFKRLRGGELSLLLDGDWARCVSCKSVHRPIPGLKRCLDCSSTNVAALVPEKDVVFVARKGYYRRPTMAALGSPPVQPMALIAAEHTAQLNAPQSEDIFSKAEENELLFQDVRLMSGTRGLRATAIDVLSSTTTMEVGIDLGALSGVALRNMPPGRANYQQRAGRAGRRGNAIATVVAFGSADSHDEHYFSEPNGMICGDVVDPRLTLDNRDIVQRHIRAFLLQCYHQDRLPEIDESQRHDLFSVLGTVSEFRSGKGLLNRADFAAWLTENEREMQRRAAAWIPEELSSGDRAELLASLREDAISAVDDAIRASSSDDAAATETDEEVPEVDEGTSKATNNIGTLLNRLLYCGKLPRYAFPTDVATFHVFDPDRSSYFHPIMRYAPSQGLPIALTQYAPGKQVWIAGKCYTSGAIYSVMSDDRFAAWEAKRRYLECRRCGFAETLSVAEVDAGEIRDCRACRGHQTFGPARNWMRPPGFAHPIDLEEVTSPDEIPETSYATRAKLTMSTPSNDGAWNTVNERVKGLSLREHLLVSNSGPKHEGYLYCTKCGRIEASTDPDKKLLSEHRRPYPERDSKKICEGGGLTHHLVLGTDFITDIALFSLRVEPPMRLIPGDYPTDVALRTVSEALAKAAAKLLEIEPGELLAEYRPALTEPGTKGLEAEIFLYDTLPGGAGFAGQLPGHGGELLRVALTLLKTCPEDCDASCYRCLRSFKNKFEHSLLDRHVGAELLEFLVNGEVPSFDAHRLMKSSELLANDITRNRPSLNVEIGAKIKVGKSTSRTAPIKLTRTDGAEFVVVVAGPLEIDHPIDPIVSALNTSPSGVTVIPVNELTIRGNLPDATKSILDIVGE